MTAYDGTENLEVMADAVNYNRYLLSLIRSRISQGDRIADIGAGIGTFARALAADGCNIHCVEPDPQQSGAILAAGLPVVASADALPDEAFDFVYSLNVLEHIDDDLAAATTWVRKLKLGGRMLIYVPAFQVLYSSMDRKVGHRRRYRRSSLAAVMRDAGLRVDRIRYADSAGFLAAIAFKAFGNDDGHIDRRGLIMFDRLVFPISRLMDLALSHVVGKNLVLFGVRDR